MVARQEAKGGVYLLTERVHFGQRANLYTGKSSKASFNSASGFQLDGEGVFCRT